MIHLLCGLAVSHLWHNFEYKQRRWLTLISGFFPLCDAYDEDVQTVVVQTSLQKEIFLLSMWANVQNDSIVFAHLSTR